MPAQSDLTPQDEVRLGHHAAELLADPVLAKTFADMDAQIVADWKATQDPLERELLHHRATLLGEFKKKLEVLVGRGEWAENDIKVAARREKFGENR